jgi:hypothetical protein
MVAPGPVPGPSQASSDSSSPPSLLPLQLPLPPKDGEGGPVGAARAAGGKWEGALGIMPCQSKLLFHTRVGSWQ